MKIVNVPLARAAWLVDLWKANPKGRTFVDVFGKLATRYQFAKPPQNPLDVKNAALEFQAGTFEYEGVPLAVGLQIYNNGIVGDTNQSTDASEAFLQDVTKWLRTEYELDLPSVLIRKAFTSNLDLECDTPVLTLLNPQLNEFAKYISERTSTLDGIRRKFDVSGLSFFPEDIGTAPAPVPFRFERKWGTPPERNVYFSTASARTQEHLELLNELERILKVNLTESSARR